MDKTNRNTCGENMDKKISIDRDTIKYLAVIPMAVGHFIGYMEEAGAMTDKPLWLTILVQLSLIAPPIFFYLLAEGFRYTHSRKKYALRLLIFAVITQISFSLVNFGTLLTVDAVLNWNIIFTLFLGFSALCIWESKLELPLRIGAVILVDAATVLLCSEWTIFGIPIILGLHIFREKPKIRLIWFTVCIFCVEFISNGMSMYILISPGFLLGMFFLLTGYFLVTKCYNGRKGRHPVFSKWFFYVFYPLHLLIIYAVRLLIT
ncbi:MAG: TraX family protein [Oscillospiraceae bacterium]